jgi:DNA-binding beta-propeller fold protein YncE
MQLAALVSGLALAGALATGCGSSSTTTTTPSSGASSGSMAVLNLGGDTYAFVPSLTGMSKVKLSSGGSLALSADVAGAAASQPLVLTPLPDACAADYKNNKVVCASYSSDKVHVIDAGGNTLVGTYATGLTAFASFSGGSCIICGLLYDETDNKIIMSTAAGYALFDHLGTHTITKTITANPSENFGYDITKNRIFSAWYGYSGVGPAIDLIDVASGSVYTLSPPPVGLSEPDHGAVDLKTGIAYATEESGHNAYLFDLGNAQLGKPAAGQFQATTANVTITTLIGSRLTDVAIDSDAHYAFLSEEFGASMGVAKLPAAGGGTPALGDYAVATIPNPPASYWYGSGDPHGISNFTLSSGSQHYGLLVDGGKTWLAVVDMDKLLAAPRNAATHDVQATYDLVTNGVVKFYGL